MSRTSKPVTSEFADRLSLSASERKALGPLQSEHVPASRTHKINIAIASIFTILPALAAVGLGIDALIGAPGRGIGWAALAFGALALLPAIGVYFLVRKLFWRLFLFANGFVFLRGKEHVVLWSDIKSLFVGGLNIDEHLQFILDDGTRLKIDNSFKDYSDFADAVRDNETRRVLARADAALKSGESFSFSKLRVTPAGLEHEGKQALAWANVERVSIERRVSGQVIYSAIVVWEKARGKKDPSEWAAKNMGMFPNFDAFLKLAARLTRIDVQNSI
jgi:hypothetical protein